MLQSSRFIELPVGGVLQLNCSSSSMYLIEFMEIGQSLTVEDEVAYGIEQDGNPRVRYSQEGCLYNVPPHITCIKTLEMDIVESLHGKSFQCRARTREMNPIMYYSEGSYLHGTFKMTCIMMYVLCIADQSRAECLNWTLAGITIVLLYSPDIICVGSLRITP